MSSRITLLFLALKTFVFIPQAVITFSIILPFSVPIAISFFFSEFLQHGSSLSYMGKLIFCPSLFIFFIHYCFFSFILVLED